MQVSSTAKLWQALPAGVGVLPSGLWQRSGSGAPFTLEEDPPCGEICGSAQELLSTDGNHKKEPYKETAKLNNKKKKTTHRVSLLFYSHLIFVLAFSKFIITVTCANLRFSHNISIYTSN